MPSLSRERAVTSSDDFAAIALGPLAGRPGADWQKAPAGKWTPAQIIEHLALSFDLSAAGFERATGPTTRRTRTLAERVAMLFVFGLGWIPPGVESPRRAAPPTRVDAADAERHLRSALARWTALASRALADRGQGVVVRHPRLGDLDFDEWLRFHAWHCRHHAKQIRRRLAG